MRFVPLVVALAFVLAIAVSAGTEAEDRELFTQFQSKYMKAYTAQEEHEMRFQTFRTNLKRMEQHRARHPRARFGVNEFADLSEAEFRATRLAKPLDAKALRAQVPEAPEVPQAVIDALPTSFNWVDEGAVTPVKNQGQCGSCWSFSTTGNVEGQWKLAGNPLTSLSEQNLVDCDHTCGKYRNFDGCDAGCNGGLQPNAFTWIIKNGGIESEAAYPYTAMNGQCQFDKSKVVAKISNYTMVSENEDQMKAFLHEHGPIAIAADAAEWQFYMGGVFSGPCGTSLDHGILIVGYGVETDMFGTYHYWIVKNSWGTSWGLDGYLHIISGEGECGLNLFASSAIIN